MFILGAIIIPHPSLIIPTVGRGREREVQATIDAYRTAAKQVAAWNPEVLIITSPHQIMYADYFHISPGRGAAGDMSAFGASQTKLHVEYDAPLREEIIRCGEAVGDCCCPTWRAWTRWSSKSTLPSRRAASVST